MTEKKKSGFPALCKYFRPSPAARAVLFALRERTQKAIVFAWREITGWGAALLFLAIWGAGAMAGVAGVAIGATMLILSLPSNAKALSEASKVGPHWGLALFLGLAGLALAAAAARFLRGRGQTLAQRLLRFGGLGPPFDSTAEALRSVFATGWTTRAAMAIARGLLIAIFDAVCIAGLIIWGFLGFAAGVAVAPFWAIKNATAWIVAKNAASGGLKAKIAATVSSLKEEGAIALARGEQLELERTAAAAMARRNSEERPARKTPRL